jgi:hypothetical protein
MPILHPKLRIRVTQIISIVLFAALLPNKYFPESGYSHVIKPFNLYIVILFFVTQAFMIYFFIQGKRKKPLVEEL